MQLSRVCVFAGSSEGRRAEYRELAARLGLALARRRVGLVYGGARVGLMGALANAALAAGGEVIGVIPEGLMSSEVAHDGLTELIVTSNMHERKAAMASRADAFVALPGGLGTLEELFEVWTWAQLGFHDKPCALLDCMGYFDALIGFLREVVASGFIRSGEFERLLVEADPERLLDRLAIDLAPKPAVPSALSET